jgi:energy-coupling factor transport system permease protein
MSSTLFTDRTARPWLVEIDPRLKIAWVVGVSIVAVTIDPVLFPELAPINELTALGALALATAAVAYGLRLRSGGWLVILGLLALIAWTTTLTQGFFYPASPASARWTLVDPRDLGGFYFPGLAVTAEGLAHGAVQSLRLLATALAGLTLCLSTSPERILAALVRLRLPAALAFMTMAALRFLPLVIDEVRIVRQARRLRGYRFRLLGPKGDRFGSYRSELLLLLPVVAASLRRAESLAESVTARGFDPRSPRTFYPPLMMRPWEAATTLGIGLACGVLVAWRLWLYVNPAAGG